MSKPLLMLMLFAGILASPASQADEVKPQTQRTSRKPTITPATASNRKPESAAAAKSNASENKNSQEQTKNQSPSSREQTQLLQENARDVLNDLRVKPDVADKLVKEVADPDKKESAIDRVKDIANAAGELDTVGVDAKVRDRVVDAVSRSKNPKDTANETVGEAATESVFGKDVAKLVPGNKKGKFREVFISLLDIQGSLELLGAEPDAPEVVEAIKEGAQQGVTTRQDARTIMEKAAHKVLDRQGFTPGKPGESLNARLASMAEEQKILQAELDAKKAAKAKADLLAQQRAKVSAGNPGNSAITQGAAGSTTAGRSVSAKVKVAVGGGASNASGAGTAKQGTGTDATRNTGVGGANRADLASSRLAAGSGGTSSAGRPTSGTPTGTAPGASSGAPATADSVPASSQQPDVRTEAATTTTQTPQTDTSPVNNTNASNPSANTGGAAPSNPNTTVATGEMLLNSSNNNSGPTTKHYDPPGMPNVGVDITYNSDTTYSGTVTVVTKDAAGNIVSVSQTPISGTWGYDTEGNPTPATQTVGETTTAPTSGNGQGSDTSNNQQSGNNDETSNQEEGDDSDDDDDDDKTEDPPPAEQTTTDQTETEATTEESKEASTTPNPLDIGGGDPAELARRTGGRIGSQEARRQQRGLDLARSGGAAGPNPEGKGGVPTLLTPEELSNAEKALNMRRGAGVTNPNPLGKGSVVATDRDVKEMHLRRNGGAKGPTDTTGPAKPQDPRSPAGGAPGPVPSGGTRINASRTKSVAVNRNLSKDHNLALGALQTLFK
jgi:hypothetical protein